MKIQIKQTSALHEQGGRFKNEDFVYPILDGAQLDPNVSGAIPNVPGLFMVCDGIGGENKGEIASQMAVSQFAKYFDTFPPSGQVTYGYLSAALLRVEEAFSNYIQTHPESRGMGTTLALLYLDKYGATFAWIGNSRIYHYRKGEQLSKSRDHSIINDLLEQGKIGPEEVRNHPQRNVILRSIKGTEEPTDLDLFYIPQEKIEEGDFFFLCTDGILEDISDAELSTLFSSPISLEEIRQEIFSLCKGNSGDNFSFYLIETGIESKAGVGPVAAAIPPLTTPSDEEVVISPTDAGQEEKYSIEEAMVFDEASEASKEEAQTVFDRLGKSEEGKSEKAATGTVFDRIKQENTKAETPKAESGKKTEAPKAEETKTKEGPKTSPSAPPKEASGNILVPLGIIVSAVVLILAAIWIYNNRTQDPYSNYKNRALTFMESGNYDRAISLADSAFNETKDPLLQKEANKIREEAMSRKKESLSLLLDKATYHKEEGGYPGFWMARRYYQEALSGYTDVADTERIQAMIAECNTALAKYSNKQALEQMLSSAGLLCQKGYGDEASVYFSEANSLAENQDLMREVEKAELDCQSVLQTLAVASPEKDPNTTRSIEPADRSVATTNSRPEDEAEIGDLADLQSKPSTTPQKTPPAATTPAPVTRGELSPRTTTTASSQQPASTASAATAPTGPPGGFMATRDGSAPPTEAQLQSLEKGKALYVTSRSSGSKYQEKKAVEYFRKSGSALDGEAYYMLANLYNNGNGLDRDDQKVLAYAQKSSGLGYPEGCFFFASLLLPRQNRIDSNNAKEALNLAASMGHQPSLDKLQELQYYMSARVSQ